jgi:transposase-like protein
MKINCCPLGCLPDSSTSSKTSLVVRNGSYYRTSDSRRISKYYCLGCKKYFSSVSQSQLKYQKKRRINFKVVELYDSGVSQRRLARVFKIDRKTVARIIRHFARVEEEKHETFLEENYAEKPLTEIQFDDLETSIHTKCKPVSVTLAVDPETRKILNFQISEMPAKGLLASISRKKYGPRADERPVSWDLFMRELKPYVASDAVWTSDENPHYPAHLKRHYPFAIHKQKRGGRGASTGQGELKKLVFDPLFSLNHTCAMLRANMNRLFRRTWCTSKTIQGLKDHLILYIAYHNRVLTGARRI